MKKKKHLADLMEEDLLETIQQRINELNDNEAREHFLERLDRLKRKGTIRRTPYWSNSGFDATNGNGRRFKHEQRKSKHGVNAKRDDPETDFTSLLFGGKWKTWDEDGIPEGRDPVQGTLRLYLVIGGTI